ncbi:hypothetical protein [Sphingomonas pokkalii]|uniref:Transmembrane protein n=1 Tax=Sphingomonas pokkalii TaxID=2175090 RepID=A0A2U0SFN7_9SPHN|nr:hypothetical protein [Sphingomonas pokkalii]PVX30186.1 hypothetical protein DD559_13295 [Sphingomonas pokkalii]
MTNRFIATLDDLSRRTGIPALAEGKPRRRLLRWTPVVALALAIPGLGIEFLSTARPAYLGHALLTCSFVIATFCPLFGPLKPLGTAENVDEWDRDLRRRAFLVGFAAMGFTGLALFCGITAVAALGNWSASDMSFRAMGCAFFLMTLYGAVPTLYASWATRPLDPAEEEA